MKSKNSSYQMKKAAIKVNQEDIHVKELNKYADPVVSAGYFHRNNFNDYANIGISFSLPLYGTQESHVQKAKKLLLASKSNIVDFDNLLDSKISQVYAKIESEYKVYNIIQKQSLPKIEHMFALSSSSIKNGNKLSIYIDLLERKLALDEKSIDAVASYNKDLAQLESLVGARK